MPFASEKKEIAEGGASMPVVHLDSSDNAREVVGKQHLESIDEHVHGEASKSDVYQSVIDSMDAVPKFSEEWFRLKEMEINLRHDGLAADQVGGDGKSVDDDKNTTADEVAPAHEKLHAEKAARLKPELIGDGTSPDANSGLLYDGSLSYDKKLAVSAPDKSKAARLKPELIDDGTSPDANSGLLHDGSLSYDKKLAVTAPDKSKAARLMPELIDDGTSLDANSGLLHDGKKSAACAPETIKEDSSCPMPFYAMDDDVHNRNTGQVATSESHGFSAPSRDEESILYPSLEETSSPPLEGPPLVHQPHLTKEPSKTLLIEAWAVDESSASEIDDRTVYIAEEMTGCYTSKAKAIAGLCTLIVVALGITLYYVLKPTSLIPENIATASSTPTSTPSTNLVITTTEPSSKVPRETQIKDEIEATILRRGIKFDELAVDDGRMLALNWMLDKDEVKLQATSSNLGQRYILALLAFEFGKDLLSSGMECSWYWVTCNGESKVTKLELGSQNITGTVPPEISGLVSLELLDISDNTLFGTLPPEIGELTGLIELYLWKNKFSGMIPSNIGELTKLTVLSLHDNQFNSTLPTELGALTELTDLLIHINVLIGSLPTELGRLKGLTVLDAGGNQMNGTLPDLGNLTSLTKLALGNNQLRGSLPSWIGLLSPLEWLDLFRNQFTGSLPSELGELSKLPVLYLYENMFNSTIPTELGALTELTDLRIYTNDLTGSLPTELGQLKRLTILDFGNNQLSSALPTELGHLTELAELKLGWNHLSSTLPSELGRLTKLTAIWLLGNQFNGTLPDELNNLGELTSLWIQENQFTGAFAIDTSNLNELCLFDNMFTGDIPSEIEPYGECWVKEDTTSHKRLQFANSTM